MGDSLPELFRNLVGRVLELRSIALISLMLLLTLVVQLFTSALMAARGRDRCYVPETGVMSVVALEAE